MIRSIAIHPQGSKQTNLSAEEMRAALADQNTVLWVSMEHTTEEEAQLVLRDLFHFHPLTIEDCLSTGYQTPKVDDFGSYIFLIVHSIWSNQPPTEVETNELNLYLGKNFLVTVFLEEQMPPVDMLWERIQVDERLSRNGTDFLCHSLLDYLVDEYMPLLDQMDDEIEWLEDQVLSRPSPKMLQRVLNLKHTLIYLRRVVSPQREVMNRLSRDEFPMIDQLSRIYFRDVYDHLVRFQDMIENLRDIVGGTMDIYLNSTSLRLNEVMKALTIVSTIFLPLSFVAGVYGMNFERTFPAYDHPLGFVIFWGICAAIVIGMLNFFKRRGWF